MHPLLAIFGFGFMEFALLGFLACAFAFWLWMLVDCLLYETSPNDKLVWLLVIIFVGVIGAPLYFFLRKLRRPPPTTA